MRKTKKFKEKKNDDDNSLPVWRGEGGTGVRNKTWFLISNSFFKKENKLD